MFVAHRVEQMGCVHARHRQRMHVERIVEWSAERYHLLDEIRLAMRQNFREHAAAAVPDERNASRRLAMHLEQCVEQRSQHDL